MLGAKRADLAFCDLLSYVSSVFIAPTLPLNQVPNPDRLRNHLDAAGLEFRDVYQILRLDV